MKKKLYPVLALALLTACTVGPDYERPAAAVPVMYKEAGNWAPAKPADDQNRGAWWLVYNDPILDILERQVAVSNQNLKAAEAAYRQARAIVEETRATLFPAIGVAAGAERTGTLQSRPAPVSAYSASIGASWDIDVWGRIRRQLESNEASAQASAADLASAALSAQALLATDYLDIRVQDALKRLLDATVLDDRKALQIVQNQYEEGIAAKSDVIQAETQLQSVRAQSINTGVKRAQLEHAIAVLIGKPPAEYALDAVPQLNGIPAIPTGAPSALLERRPDIASAERQMAAANALIGVQTAAYFPDISLGASFGFASSALSNLVSAPTSLWSFGPSLAETIFDAGARSAAVEEARAAYDQSVANYRQVTLTAFQQVEDNLAALRILAQQSGVQDQAVTGSRQAATLVLNQYKEGIVPYSNVLTAQIVTLGNQQTALSIYESRLISSVALIQALGGGWDVSQLPR